MLLCFSTVIFSIFTLSFFNNHNIDFFKIGNGLLSLQYIIEYSNLFDSMYAFKPSYNDLLTYENQDLGIKFQYPSDWYEVENDDDEPAIFKLNKGETDPYGYQVAEISLLYGTLGPNGIPRKESLEDYRASVDSIRESGITKYEVIEEKNIFVDNHIMHSNVI